MSAAAAPKISTAKRYRTKTKRTKEIKLRMDPALADALATLTAAVKTRYNERLDAYLDRDITDFHPIRGDIGMSAIVRALVVNACAGAPEAEVSRIVETLRLQAD